MAKMLPVKVAKAYEDHKITYLVEHEYNPDFTISNKKFIEVKGYFRAADRAKHLYIAAQHPDIETYFIFGDQNNKLNKNSKTTYADWCTKYGFSFTDVKTGIPESWFT